MGTGTHFPRLGGAVDADMEKISKLIGALSDAHWRRAAQAAGGAFNALFAEPYRPQSTEEIAVWTELTAPCNYVALRRFIDSQQSSGSNEFATKLNAALLREATSRWEKQSAREKP
jgi:hypothetical protein